MARSRRTIDRAPPSNRLGPVTVIVVLPVLDFGGIESRAAIQAEGMATSEFELRICCFGQDGAAADYIRTLGVPVDVLGVSPSVRNPLATWKLWRYLRRHRPVVLHAVSGSMTVHSLLASAVTRTPVRIVEEVGIPTRGPLGRRMFPLLYRLATRVIGVSDAVIEYLVAEDGVPAGRAVRIYNAIEQRYIDHPRDKAPSGRWVVLSAGRLAPVKGHADLIRALAPLLNRDSDMELHIAGEGPERSSLEALAVRLGCSQRVRFLGQREDLPDLLAKADAFVLPSLSEGFGLAVVEAMAMGVPVIATKVGGVPEVVPSWAHEWLVPPGDDTPIRETVQRLRSLAPENRDDLGVRLSEHATQQFSPARYIEELEQLYRELLEEVACR